VSLIDEGQAEPNPIGRIAAWLLRMVEEEGTIEQEIAAVEIQREFPEFVFVNQNGNLAIDRRVLAAFRELSGDRVVWESGARLWRLREEFDSPGRGQ
jgi:hypothetical protein